jgi:hypothetical protein
MSGSNTNRVSQVNNVGIKTNVNNQDLSSDTTVTNQTNLRNHDIVHGDDIKGGMNTFNAL